MDAEAAAAYRAEFKVKVEDENHSPDLIFKDDGTGLYWKQLLSQTFIAHKEQSASRFKAAKDRLMLLLGANVSGILELKALLVLTFTDTTCSQGPTRSHVACVLEMEQEGLGDTRNLLGLINKLFFALQFSFFLSWTMPLAILQTLLKKEHL